MGGLRDRLRGRKRPSYGYPVRVAEPEETASAEAEVVACKRALDMVHMQKEPDPAQVKKRKKDLEKAETARDACYEKIPLQAMKSDEFEDLADEFPEADENAEKKVRREADEEYLTAVFLASVQDSDMSEEDWRAFLKEDLSAGERNELLNTALGLNGRLRVPNSNVPKG